MRRIWKALAFAAAGGVLACGSAVAAYSAQALTGQWCDEGEAGWWYKLDYEGNSFLANTWYWIEDEDGVIRCYCFDYNGWLLTDTEIDGERVDADGRWVDENGAVITKTPDEVEFALCTRFEAPSTGSSSSSGSSTSSSSSSALTAADIAERSYVGNALKVSGGGDTPVASSVFTAATVSGTTVTNTWAGYTMQLPVAPSPSTSDDGTDWYYTGDEYCRIFSNFYSLDFFATGNTSVSAFAKSALDSKKIFTGDKAVGTSEESFNGVNFIKATKEVYLPWGTKYNYAYIRQVPGTNYVQVISFETLDGTCYDSCMSTFTAL